MCGIMGYVGGEDGVPTVMAGLRTLEYRGYDSSGIAAITPQGIAVRRCVGKLDGLFECVSNDPVVGNVVIGHTRWATHGIPSVDNAHPHTDCSGSIVVVHNGIVENYRELKQELLAQGHAFRSQTDTEVIAHLVEKHLWEGNGLAEAVRLALLDLRGAHGVVVASASEPGMLVAARLGNAGGVVVGRGEGEQYVASDMTAIIQRTNRVTFLQDGDVATVSRHEVSFQLLNGEPVDRRVENVDWDPVRAAKGGHRHFMLKEIMEQPHALSDTLAGRLDVGNGTVHLEGVKLDAAGASAIRRLVLVACGSSWYSAQAGKFMLEQVARLPVEVDYGSEFRYREPTVDERTLVVAITQSGETADTLAAMQEARRRGARLLSIVNVLGSQASRLADDVILMHAGPEIGVASTKAITSSLACQYILAVHLGQLRRTLSPEQGASLIADAARLPELAGAALRDVSPYPALANRYFHARNFLYLGRGISFPVALEGAHKLKEISYIHAEGCPAGEMKHGLNALIDESMPVLAIALNDHLRDKMLSNIEQVQARGAPVIALATVGDTEMAERSDDVLWSPPVPYLLSPIISVIPLQLFAYHMAVRLGCDVDQPRNLAKSVTVE